MNRRDFLRALGIGAAAVAIEEPVRRMWFVPSTAPVGSRVELAARSWVPGKWSLDDHATPLKGNYDAWRRVGSTDLTFTPHNGAWFSWEPGQLMPDDQLAAKLRKMPMPRFEPKVEWSGSVASVTYPMWRGDVPPEYDFRGRSLKA